MGRRHYAAVAIALILPWTATSLSQAQIIASSGFNDQSGLNSNPTPNSPFTIGQTVDNRGSGEPGWAGNWAVSQGGASGGGEHARILSEAAREGDGGLLLEPNPTFITTRVVRGLATRQSRRFIIEQDINFVGVKEVYSRPASFTGNQPGSIGPQWRLFGPVGNRRFQVVDGQGNGVDYWEDTGIAQRPGQWQHVTLDIDVPTQQFTFAVDGVRYNAPDPLGFTGTPASIDYTEYITNSSGWIDGVIVRLPQSLSGDANRDGSVNGTDFALLAGNFGVQSGADWSRGDFNSDGAVNGTDFALLAGNFGKSGGDPPFPDGGALVLTSQPGALPEPSTLCLLLGLPALLLRRARSRRPSPRG